jgi:hypothetical protein
VNNVLTVLNTMLKKAVEWGDIDLKKRQLCVRRSVWKGQTSTPKGGRLRYVPLMERLTTALHAASRFPGPQLFCDQEGRAVSWQGTPICARHSGTCT